MLRRQVSNIHVERAVIPGDYKLSSSPHLLNIIIQDAYVSPITAAKDSAVSGACTKNNESFLHVYFSNSQMLFI